MFLDDTACNLASLNLMTFRDAETGGFDVAAFEHACRLWTIVLEISVLMAQFPSRQIAELSYRYRTLGLGFANIGGLLMASGIPYDSPEGRAICGAISAIMTGVSYATSAEMARGARAVPRLSSPTPPTCCASSATTAAPPTARRTATRSSRPPPVPLDHAACPDDALIEAAKRAWDSAIALGQEHGFRNAQATVIAPTGTIGLVMDCDTTGIEPDFALVKFKKLAGGGYFKIINQRRAGGAAHARLPRSRDRRDRGLRRRPRLAGAGAGHQPRDAQGQGLHRRGAAPRSTARSKTRLRHQVRLQPWTLGESVPRPTRSRFRPTS